MHSLCLFITHSLNLFKVKAFLLGVLLCYMNFRKEKTQTEVRFTFHMGWVMRFEPTAFRATI